MDKAHLKKVIKTRNFGIVLYPDNPYHMQYLDYLENTHDGFYILHEKNADNALLPLAGYEYEHHNEKAHYHCVVQFKNPRTVSGFLKRMPIVKYYQPLALENIDDETKSRFYTVYDVSYVDIPVQEVYKPVIEYAEPITDIYGYALYMLHRDFDSFVKGKKTYNLSDVKPLFCDVSRFSEYFKQNETSDAEILDIIYQILACAGGDTNTFIQLCSMHSNPLVLKYVSSHSYFIHRFLLSPNSKIVEKEYLND